MTREQLGYDPTAQEASYDEIKQVIKKAKDSSLPKDLQPYGKDAFLSKAKKRKGSAQDVLECDPDEAPIYRLTVTSSDQSPGQTPQFAIAGRLLQHNVSDITFFTEPITAILVQRFLFHLQSANCRALDMDSASQVGGAVTQQSSSLVFNPVIGSLGASIPSEDFLGPSEDDGVEDEEEGGMGSTSASESET
ncbi:hypothetical protein LXA43DRAFT_1143465 [Ganoderma leucocontextum]|nr:hypothetical protein LXA43DRAFT_1143465 [Ganoderma leucocontextum]